MVELVSDLRAEVVRANLTRVRSEIAAARERSPSTHAGRERRQVEILAASKYIALEDMPTLAQAGVHLVGENRAQDLQAKVAAHGELFEWDFIGQLQSRRVRLIVPHVRLIHSLASQSALAELERHIERARPGLRVLLEVNVAGEQGKAGLSAQDIDAFIARSPVPVAGLMTMPPLSPQPESSRGWFAALRELADERGLEHLSMGTSQDYLVAVEEGATIVRIGTKLYDPQTPASLGGPSARSVNY
jgi:pyridoxal phosphate enzyme (YggS family)